MEEGDEVEEAIMVIIEEGSVANIEEMAQDIEIEDIVAEVAVIEAGSEEEIMLTHSTKSRLIN